MRESNGRGEWVIHPLTWVRAQPLRFLADFLTMATDDWFAGKTKPTRRR